MELNYICLCLITIIFLKNVLFLKFIKSRIIFVIIYKKILNYLKMNFIALESEMSSELFFKMNSTIIMTYTKILQYKLN